MRQDSKKSSSIPAPRLRQPLRHPSLPAKQASVCSPSDSRISFSFLYVELPTCLDGACMLGRFPRIKCGYVLRMRAGVAWCTLRFSPDQARSLSTDAKVGGKPAHQRSICMVVALSCRSEPYDRCVCDVAGPGSSHFHRAVVELLLSQLLSSCMDMVLVAYFEEPMHKPRAAEQHRALFSRRASRASESFGAVVSKITLETTQAPVLCWVTFQWHRLYTFTDYKTQIDVKNASHHKIHSP